MASLRDFLVGNLMPEKCFEHIFIRGRFHAPCLKFAFGKLAGFWIFLNTFLAHLPQLLRILWRGSAEGLSASSALLQVYASSCPVVYALANNFPFFAWAEMLFPLTQTAAIFILIMHHERKVLRGLLLLLLLLGLAGSLLLLTLSPAPAVASAVQASSSAALITSKAVQMTINNRNGHTGQLSTTSVFLTWTGSVGFVILSLQESGYSLSSLSHSVSSCLSFLLLLQVLCMSHTAAAAAAAAKKIN